MIAKVAGQGLQPAEHGWVWPVEHQVGQAIQLQIGNTDQPPWYAPHPRSITHRG